MLVRGELMNNDGESSITFHDEYPVEKFIRFLPAGPTANGVREQPLIQFYCERTVDTRGNEHFYTVRTIGLEDIIGIKGLTDAKLRQRIHDLRSNRVEPEPKPAKVRRRKNLNQ